MTNAELIAKIKAEVERRKTVQLKRIQEGDLVDSAPYDKNEAYNEILSFLSTLESEKPMELEEEISRTYHDGSVTDTSDLDHNSYENIARHFYELGCRRTAEKYDEIEYNRQRAEESPLPEDTVLFNKGVEEGKRLMMEDAVECYYGYVNNCTKVFLPEKTPKGVKEGYARIVILKNDE